ncbi:MAG TPA: Uma2 family endonuclease [Gemmataceae bacterium]|nr:Uma2 family endonuclease [Gemmataceae bacterium]
MHDEPALLEPDDLLQMPDGESYELVDGRLVEKNMGAESDRIALRLGGRIDRYCDVHKMGFAFGAQTGFRCFPSRPRLVRKPDVSMVLRARLPEGAPKGDILISPDFAVEVVSPNDTYEEVEAKVNEYLSAGVRLVWVISPTAKTVLIRRPDKSSAALDINDVLNGEDVLPGFTCPVAELFG